MSYGAGNHAAVAQKGQDNRPWRRLGVQQAVSERRADLDRGIIKQPDQQRIERSMLIGRSVVIEIAESCKVSSAGALIAVTREGQGNEVVAASHPGLRTPREKP